MVTAIALTFPNCVTQRPVFPTQIQTPCVFVASPDSGTRSAQWSPFLEKTEIQGGGGAQCSCFYVEPTPLGTAQGGPLTLLAHLMEM